MPIAQSPMPSSYHRSGPRSIGPADRHVGRQIGGPDNGWRGIAEVDDRGRVHGIGERFHADPKTRGARHRPADHTEAKHLGDVGRVKHRNRRIEKRIVRLRRQACRFAGVVVAGYGEDAATRRGAGRIGMFQRIAGSIDAGAFGVPDRENAVAHRAG
jgi:hypothetical protein